MQQNFSFPRVILFSLLAFFLCQSSSYAGEMSFSWTPNSEDNLAGYKIYYGTETANYTESIDVGLLPAVDGLVTYSVTDLPEGNTLYFAATAYDFDGFESDYSQEVVCVCPLVAGDDTEISDSDAVFTGIIDDLPNEEVSAVEETALLVVWEGQKLSRDLYETFYKMWSSQVFINMFASAQTQMDSVQLLLEKYALSVPEDVVGTFNEPGNQALYDSMIGAGSASTNEALYVCASMEEKNVYDLQDLLSQADSVDIQTVYQNLLKSARNHLRLLVSQLSQAAIDYAPQYVSVEEFATIMDSSVETGMYDENGDSLFQSGEWVEFVDSDNDGVTDLLEISQMYEQVEKDASYLQGRQDGYQTYLAKIKRFQRLNRKYLKQIKSKKRLIRRLQ